MYVYLCVYVCVCFVCLCVCLCVRVFTQPYPSLSPHLHTPKEEEGLPQTSTFGTTWALNEYNEVRMHVCLSLCCVQQNSLSSIPFLAHWLRN